MLAICANALSLMSRKSSDKSSGEAGGALGDVKFSGIDVLNLSLGKMRFIDLENPALSRELEMNIRDYVLKNVKSRSDFMGVLVLIWLRNGFSVSGSPMATPPQIFSFSNGAEQDEGKK